MSCKQRIGKRYWQPALVGLLAIVLLGSVTSSAWAGMILTHAGTNDPVAEGWLLGKSATASGAASPDGLAWRLTVASGRASYVITKDSEASLWSAYQAALASTDGWTATATAKLVSNPDLGNTGFTIYGGPNSEFWRMSLLDGNGSGPAGVYVYTKTGHMRWSEIDPTLAYHAYQMIYDPDYNPGGGEALGRTSFYMDGGLLGTLTHAQSVAGAASANYYAFGDFVSSDASTSTHDWAFVEFRTGQHPIPEPATMVLLGSGLLALPCCARRRRK